MRLAAGPLSKISTSVMSAWWRAITPVSSWRTPGPGAVSTMRPIVSGAGAPGGLADSVMRAERWCSDLRVVGRAEQHVVDRGHDVLVFGERAQLHPVRIVAERGPGLLVGGQVREHEQVRQARQGVAHHVLAEEDPVE